ncbi:polysaccharide pyruvyl transferase family protein [Rhizobium sp.]|uniref:polysaccharide pyruvyl transferase family protein n=1 Tax=Rhizobium sp. TaxID=391 RepID=UPI00289D9207
MQILALKWLSNNIGDDVQTIAVMQHLPRVDAFVDRDHLSQYDGPPAILVTNGWFLEKLENWPPSKNIRPIFFGFHVQERAKPTIAQHAEYLKKHAPIGCRDRATVDFVRSLGVEAYLSLCSTLTFEPPSDRAPDSIYLVEADENAFTRRFRKNHGLKLRTISHRVAETPTDVRLAFAKSMVETYGRKAALVVTKRIHCAMPCIAMGVPTVFIGPKTDRTSVVEEIGLERRDPWHPITRPFAPRISEIPAALDISGVKTKIKADLQARIAAALA